ncbi:MAG: TolC family protein [Bacteriovoracaceae bacterium]|jgi:outer membrane protein TolC|nr:TolC family protein [Bacteriovoracaceae bacterium]
MKYLLIITLLSCFGNLYAEEKVITLDEVATKVKESNFNVLENAQRIYQAKETITFSKRNLLPRLNFWNILKLPFDWTSAIDIVQDIAPFLVPNNWFRVSQSKLFYLAQKEQYRALWANEVMTAKLLYINTLRDQDFLNLLKDQKDKVAELIDIVKTRAVFGEVPAQVLRFLQIRELELTEDIRSLNMLVSEEKRAIGYLMGIPQEENIALESISLPKVEELQTISFETFIFRALDNAPEINQYQYIKASLRFLRKEAYFSFLGASTTSRGVGGGVFNNLPLQDGLGFGLGSSLRIAKSQGHIIDLNSKATKEVIKKNLFNLVNNFNSFIQNIDNQNERFALANDNYNAVRTQLVLGMNIPPLEILTSIENLFDASISLTNYKYEVVNTMEKLKRSIFNGDYSKKEGKLESVLSEGGK